MAASWAVLCSDLKQHLLEHWLKPYEGLCLNKAIAYPVSFRAWILHGQVCISILPSQHLFKAYSDYKPTSSVLVSYCCLTNEHTWSGLNAIYVLPAIPWVRSSAWIPALESGYQQDVFLYGASGGDLFPCLELNHIPWIMLCPSVSKPAPPQLPPHLSSLHLLPP